MPQSFPCDVCHEVAADFMISDVHDGTVTAVGVECLLDWAMPIAEAFVAAQMHEPETGAEPAPLADPADAEWEASGEAGRPKSDGPAGEATEEDPEAVSVPSETADDGQ